MKLPCSIVTDLLPLYHDDVLSFDSKMAVEEHLTSCSECRAKYAELCSSDYIEKTSFDEDKAERMAASYRYFKRRRIKKAVILSIVGLIAAAITFFAVRLIRSIPYYPTPEREVDSIETIDEDLEKWDVDLLVPKESAFDAVPSGMKYKERLASRKKDPIVEGYEIYWRSNVTGADCRLYAYPSDRVIRTANKEIRGVPVRMDVSNWESGEGCTVKYQFLFDGAYYELNGTIWLGASLEQYEQDIAQTEAAFDNIIESMLPY